MKITSKQLCNYLVGEVVVEVLVAAVVEALGAEVEV